MQAHIRHGLGRAFLSVLLIAVVLIAVAAFGLGSSVRAAARGATLVEPAQAALPRAVKDITTDEAPSVPLPERPAAQGGGAPIVDGLFYGKGTDGVSDSSKYSKLAENPGESTLYYYLDGNDLYAALLVDPAFNDNVFGIPGNGTPNDAVYLQSAGWSGTGNAHPASVLIGSDHSVWNLFCGGDQWMWAQDYLYDPNRNYLPTEADWLSDPYGPDGMTPPPATILLQSASSLQWNINYNTTLRPVGYGWDVTLTGTRVGTDMWKSVDLNNDNDVRDEGWGTTWYAADPSGQTFWEWQMVYEVKIDISQCGGNPFTLWPVTGHNSPAKGGNPESTVFYEWGDLPEGLSGVPSYPTTLAQNGPRHVITSTPIYLGNVLDPDSDGQPSEDALGDDEYPAGLADDEDGVFVSDLASITSGQPVNIRVIATNGTTGLAYLYGFIDYNGDGDFLDANEMTYITVPAGTHEQIFTLSFGTAPSLTPGAPIYSRFRISTNLAAISVPTGVAPDGEVEDYVNYPTWVMLEEVSAYQDRGRVVVRWTTAAEFGTVGFNVLREDARTGEFVPVNEDLLVALLGSGEGGTYRLVDDAAVPGKTYTYKIVEVGLEGSETAHGPFTVRATSSGPAMKERYSAQVREVSADKQARIAARQAELAQSAQATAQAAGSQLKIAVREPGLYRIEASDVARLLGNSVSAVKNLIKTGGLQLANLGQPVAYTPASDNSALFFYGEGVDSIYTEENVYWLKVGSGLLMKASGGSGPQAAPGVLTFVDTTHAEEDALALVGLQLDPESDYWAWGLQYAPGPATAGYEVSSDGAAGSGTASLRVRLFGASADALDPDHHTRVSINGHPIGELFWDGVSPYESVFEFDAAWLVAGANTVQVTEVAVPGVRISVIYVDSFDLTYQRLYQAVNDRLLLRGDGNAVVTVSGFSSNDILVLDLSAPEQPRIVTARTIGGAAGDYQVSFKPTSASSNYLVVARGAATAPARMWADKTSNLAAATTRGDYVVITPAEFSAAAQTLAAYRQGQGLRTVVVDVEDIYDEFNYGLSSPEAIKAFLSRAYNSWKQKPRYVVLAGEGTYDYKDNKGFHDNVIPTLMTLTPYGLFASDTSLVDVVGDDGLPEMSIGRLPAVTSQELGALVAKIKSYEASSGSWARRVLMVADNPDRAGNFHNDSDEMSGLLPATYTPVPLYLGSVSAPATKQKLIEEINKGAMLLNYIGHGGRGQLADEFLLASADAAALDNANALPVMTAITCLAGDFGNPGYDSLSESLLLRAGGGIVAGWAPTGLSVNPLSMMLDRGFFEATFQNGQKVLGDAIRSSQGQYLTSGGARYTVEIYNLLGDPALRVK